MLEAVAERCAGPLGRELARSLPFAATRDEARAWLAQSIEAKGLLDRDAPLSARCGVDDVREAIDRARVGAVLAPAELRALGRMLAAARGLRRFLSARKAETPALFDACATDPTLDEVADEILSSFEPDGTLADRASPRLRELRAEYQAARQRMLSRMQDLMSRYEAVLQDRFVTEREGRWVLPVRSDSHERFPGIVHATSASGATLFVEPRAVVPMGNRLKVLEADVQREQQAVYARLTALVTDALPSVEAAARAIAVADVRGATAALGRDLCLAFPEIVDEPRLDLKRARHVLLALAVISPDRSPRSGMPVAHVVASDLAIEAGRAVVVSGPNAGGKTVALEAMGLAALSVRAGLPVACEKDSTVGIFDVVLTDVGDDQSLQKNLSTFSAHVSNLTSILGDTARGALVLLDELAGGTDPREGEALAAAVLDSLVARGGAVAATTHYEGLKALALADPRFVNASVGFDLSSMTPTFEVAFGVPGGSSALAVARRFGMPATVIERAERFLSRDERDFETVVKKLHDERAALELARAAADDREREAAATRTRLEAEVQAARTRDQRALSDEARELMDRLRRAREELRGAQARLRAKKIDAAGLRSAAAAIDRVAREVAIGGPLEPLVAPADETPREAVSASELRAGSRVWVSKLRAQAQVVEVLEGDRVRVAAGPLKLTVHASELRAGSLTPAPPASRPALRALDPEPLEDAPVPTRDDTCDLRGLRVDDAVAMATSFLDRAINAGRRAVFLLHGHGTGALREAIRAELARSTYVAKFRAAGSAHGGDGVTIVWLA